ncbi:hypothetical protein GCM10025876_18010 [Demequina litorisediminis]|uniref:Uncharacterized protein n=1 Tax=Demequina litorisediminis TaxID=1849022 RepID=A0ABQ6IEK6_9MICO|nr:hypothetical protein GCM10025876_18010 [Demequina litorisediminis]
MSGGVEGAQQPARCPGRQVRAALRRGEEQEAHESRAQEGPRLVLRGARPARERREVERGVAREFRFGVAEPLHWVKPDVRHYPIVGASPRHRQA